MNFFNENYRFLQEVFRSQRLPWDRRTGEKTKKSASHHDLMYKKSRNLSQTRKSKHGQIRPYESWCFECAESHGSNEIQIFQNKKNTIFEKQFIQLPKSIIFFRILKFCKAALQMNTTESCPKLKSISITRLPEGQETLEAPMICISDLNFLNENYRFLQEVFRSQSNPWDRRTAKKAKKSASHHDLMYKKSRKSFSNSKIWARTDLTLRILMFRVCWISWKQWNSTLSKQKKDIFKIN